MAGEDANVWTPTRGRERSGWVPAETIRDRRQPSALEGQVKTKKQYLRSATDQHVPEGAIQSTLRGWLLNEGTGSAGDVHG